ncbi:unnamed protein product [Prorocentrum cordatum]|uniref:Ppx/GppA phosphatase N-terminal domain-containing protein n=1 Tax=Prorocentrum cordatum TaxID=2364126 RepID=A0ABN9RBG7_9DINO|nr:unnamed protein product [Polarella glacialis]
MLEHISHVTAPLQPFWLKRLPGEASRAPLRASADMLRRRASFDIGSGATKLMVADVELGPPARIMEVHFAQEVPVGFMMALRQSGDGTLSPAIQDQGMEVMRALVAKCQELAVGAGSRCAVATEVFRKASNGADYLRRVKEELGLEAPIVTQEAEARLGFLTAVALQGRQEEEVVCWDSGGGSFQVTSTDPCGGPLRTFLGALGSGNSLAMLVEDVQRHSFAEHPSPNPVSGVDAAALVARMRACLSEPPSWLRGARVTAIGGPNSMFQLAADILGSSTYTGDNVREALGRVVGRTDGDLATSYCQGDDREPPSLCVPKICLLLAVVEHCGLAEVSFQQAIGSCAGLLISGERYAEGC